MIGRLFETVGGLYQLARLGVVTRFDFRGAYWEWRLHTAFGSGARGMPAGRMALARAVLDYGRWAHRMRRQM
ncbi:MAG: hypothetical protein JNM07_07940 [Phycisphaerae bacterium]|nr:hypothetical protein [Phycisphaerae bacterium]